jgi:hypothetical protein
LIELRWLKARPPFDESTTTPGSETLISASCRLTGNAAGAVYDMNLICVSIKSGIVAAKTLSKQFGPGQPRTAVLSFRGTARSKVAGGIKSWQFGAPL